LYFPACLPAIFFLPRQQRPKKRKASRIQLPYLVLCTSYLVHHRSPAENAKRSVGKEQYHWWLLFS
jgi:hypothetical protein